MTEEQKIKEKQWWAEWGPKEKIAWEKRQLKLIPKGDDWDARNKLIQDIKDELAQKHMDNVAPMPVVNLLKADPMSEQHQIHSKEVDADESSDMLPDCLLGEYDFTSESAVPSGKLALSNISPDFSERILPNIATYTRAGGNVADLGTIDWDNYDNFWTLPNYKPQWNIPNAHIL